jgi:myo-inositol-1(or 4)-monophosphatase
MTRTDDLARIEDALDAAEMVLADFTSGDIASTRKSGGSPLTEADLAVNDALRSILPETGEGWLSEETADDKARLACPRVWVVDPIDGTKEFVEGIPEWCVSIGLVEGGQPVAGGIVNPATNERVIGAVGVGVTTSGTTPAPVDRMLTVGASRSEVDRGEWGRFSDLDLDIVTSGSVAYKLALVAAGVLDATWTLVPKHEWDVAGGAALVLASGGWVANKDGSPRTWNQPTPWLPGFIATSSAARKPVSDLLLT